MKIIKISKLILLPIFVLAVLSGSNNQVMANDFCDRLYDGFCSVCRNLPENDKVKRALCWTAAGAAYGCCKGGRSFGSGGGFGFYV